MGFFDSLPRPEPAPRPPRPKLPAWVCPQDVVPACLPFERVLVHTGSLAVYVNNVRVYPDGVELTVHVRRPRDTDAFHDPRLASPFGGRTPHRHGDDDGSVDQALRLGVLYADGRAARADGFHPLDSRVQPPLITYSSSQGSEGRWDQEIWIWGLPKQGSITVVYSWLAENVSEASFVLDGQELRAAASRATVLWPASPDS